MPLASGGRWRTAVPAAADPGAKSEHLIVPTGVVDTGFFAASGIEIGRGRPPSRSDHRDAAPVDEAVVTEAMAARLWPGQDALGQRFRYLDSTSQYEIVGVIRDVNYHEIGEATTAVAFLPRPPGDWAARTLVVRTATAPVSLIEPLLQRVRELAPELPVTHVRTGADIIEGELSATRLGTQLLAALGGVTLVLALIGIYAVVAQATARRYREIAIRRALGAGRRDVVRLVLRQGMAPIAAGLGAGLTLAAAGSRFVTGLLYGSSPFDPGTALTVLTGLLLASGAAQLVPAWKAVASPPAPILRRE